MLKFLQFYAVFLIKRKITPEGGAHVYRKCYGEFKRIWQRIKIG